MRYVLLLFLAGCAVHQTPDEILTAGEKTTYKLTRPADLAAGCIARNVESHRQGYTGNVRPVEGGYEVAIRFDIQNTALVRVAPEGTGSRATVYLRDGYVYRRDELVPAMIQGC